MKWRPLQRVGLILVAGLVAASLWRSVRSTAPAADHPRPVAEERVAGFQPMASGSSSRPSRAAAKRQAEDPRPLAEKLAEVDALAWREDAESLAKILAHLKHGPPELRAAALAAVREFGSREAIPELREIAAATRDAAEQLALEEAIDYLELPTLIEKLDATEADDH